MPQKMLRLCRCKDCLKARRDGKVLGTRKERAGTWRYGQVVTEGYSVSDYVSHPKFRKGRRPDIKDTEDAC